MAGDKRFSRLGTKVADLGQAAADRLLDAEVLRAGERHASAIAMGLYALEITLKIAICRRLDLDALPVDFRIHDFDGLLILTGLSRRIRKRQFAGVRRNWTPILEEFNTKQINKLRYSSSNFTDEQVGTFLDQLRDPTHGVMTWLSARS